MIVDEQKSTYTKLEVNALALVFRTHGCTLQEGKAAIPCGTHIDASRESRHQVCKANTKRRVLETHGTESKTRDGSSLADTAVDLPSGASGKVDLLLESELAYKVASLGVSILPVAETLSPW